MLNVTVLNVTVLNGTVLNGTVLNGSRKRWAGYEDNLIFWRILSGSGENGRETGGCRSDEIGRMLAQADRSVNQNPLPRF